MSVRQTRVACRQQRVAGSRIDEVLRVANAMQISGPDGEELLVDFVPYTIENTRGSNQYLVRWTKNGMLLLRSWVVVPQGQDKHQVIMDKWESWKKMHGESLPRFAR